MSITETQTGEERKRIDKAEDKEEKKTRFAVIKYISAKPHDTGR